MSLPILSNVRFYIALIFYKLAVIWECRSYRLEIFRNEITFVFHALLKFRRLKSENLYELLIKTVLGNFYIRNIPIDLTMASPAYERLDIRELTNRIRKSLESGKRVVFVDVGTGIGKYSIVIGKAFSKYGTRMRILAFEPEKESFLLVNRNVKLNKLNNIKTYNLALSNNVGKRNFFYYRPMKMLVSFMTEKLTSIRTDKLDNYLKNITWNSDIELFIKLDVEGHEIDVLQGGEKMIKKAYRAILLIEDVINTENLKRYLSGIARLLVKITPQNSFWETLPKN